MLLIVSLGLGCATPIGVRRVSPMRVQQELTHNVLNAGTPSNAATQFLYRLSLVRRFDREPAQVLAELRSGLGDPDEHDRLFALAELSFLHATQHDGRAYFLDAACYAYAFLFPIEPSRTPRASDPRLRVAADLYNNSIAAGLASDDGEVDLRPRILDLSFGTVQLDADPDGFSYAGFQLESFVPTDDLLIRGLRNRYHQPGIGASLAARTGESGAADADKWIPPRSRVPVTLFLRFEEARAGIDSGRLRATVEVYDVTTDPTVTIGSLSLPLEHDPSMALAYRLEGAPIWDVAIAGFRRGDFDFLGDTHPSGLFMLRPYYPQQIPVVFVHGTASSPARWAEMANELMADPGLRGRYQYWYFLYHTGNPVGFSSLRLRRALTAAIADIDPAGEDAALRQMIVVGHSQGGLLTKMTAVDAGARFWENVADVPFEDADISDATRHLLDGVDDIEPLPFVRRVIFICTPHRGSFLAENWLGSLARRLIRIPASFTHAVTEIIKLNPQGALAHASRMPTSIDGMRADNPFVRTLSSLPIAPGIAANSIIAVRGDGPPEEGNDGVVTYQSAHIDGVESELVVRSGHSAQHNPKTIEEVRRILYLHAARAGVDASAAAASQSPASESPASQSP